MAKRKTNIEEVKEIKVEETKEVVNEVVEEVKEEKPEFPKMMKVIAKAGLRIRENTSLTSNQISIVPYEQAVEVLEIVGDWAKVEKGFMLLEFLQ